MIRLLRTLFAFVVALALPLTASASPVIFYGIDPGATYGSALTASNLAAANFDAAVASLNQQLHTVNFETTPLGAVTSPIAIAPGVTLGVGDSPNSAITNIQNLFGMFDTDSLLQLSANGWEFVPYKSHARIGKLYLTHTVLEGRYSLRLCIGQTHTEDAHVQQAWELIQQNAKLLEGSGAG